MRHVIACLGVFILGYASFAEAASDVKPPIVLLPREAKLSPGLMTFVSSTLPGPYVGGWMDKTRVIDFELKVEPGRYRLVASLVPQGGGYLSAKVDDGQPIRRQVARIREAMFKPLDLKLGEIDIPKTGAHLRFTGDSISPPGLCLFFQAQLTWVAPLPTATKAKSPLQLAAEKELAAKEAVAAKTAQQLQENLKGTAWSFYVMNGDFSGQSVPMVFGVDGRLSLFGKTDMAYKVIDGRTLDVFYGAPGAFSRLRFADDLGSFKSDPEEGIRLSRSGRQLNVLASTGAQQGAPTTNAVPRPAAK